MTSRPVVEVGERTSWAESVRTSSARFERTLDELGYTDSQRHDLRQLYYQALDSSRFDEEVARSLREDGEFSPYREFEAMFDEEGKRYHDRVFYTGGELARRWMDWARQRIAQILGWETIRVEECRRYDLKVRLFTLHAPEAPNCKVTYKETTETKNERSWSLTVLGSGMGEDQSLSITSSQCYMAASGECKVIWSSIPLRISRLGIYAKGKLIRHALRTEVDPDVCRSEVHLGVDSRPVDECQELFPQGGRDRRYDLSRDRSGSCATYVEAVEQSETTNLELGVEAFDLESKTTVAITRLRKIEIESELAAGFDYYFRIARDRLGVYWKVASA